MVLESASMVNTSITKDKKNADSREGTIRNSLIALARWSKLFLKKSMKWWINQSVAMQREEAAQERTSRTHVLPSTCPRCDFDLEL